MSEYTPSVDKVCDVYVEAVTGVAPRSMPLNESTLDSMKRAFREFNRMIAGVREEAIREAAQPHSEQDARVARLEHIIRKLAMLHGYDLDDLREDGVIS